MNREIVLDTETTGLDPIKGSHRITEIGCVELVNHIPTGKVFQSYLNPERDVDPSAMAITGLSYEFLKDKPLFKDVAGAFLDFIDTDTLIIHNAQFDIKFLNFELRHAGHPTIKNDVIDTLLLARTQFPGSPANLDALCKRFDVSTDSRVKHGALLDSELLAKVYLMLIGGPQIELFKKNAANQSEAVSANTLKFPIRSFSINSDDLQKHKEFLNKIPNSIWIKD